MRAGRVEFALALCATAGAACGAGDIASRSSAPAEGTETVVLTVNHRSEWRVLWVEGQTDLPDGALVNYRVAHEVGKTSPVEAWPVNNLIAEGRAAVRDGTYWAKINTLNWPSGQVRVLIQFPLPPQPPAVEERFGTLGEHLTGDNVTVLDGMKAIEVEHTLEHRR